MNENQLVVPIFILNNGVISPTQYYIFIQNSQPLPTMPPPILAPPVENSKQKGKLARGKTSKSLKMIPSKNYWLDPICMNRVFEQLSTQELLKAKRVCKKWLVEAKTHLEKISLLKITSPSIQNYRIEPCPHLPTGIPCSRQKKFATTLASYNAETNEGVSYFHQIETIFNNLKDNQINSLDIYGTPRLVSALTNLLFLFKDNLERLSLNKVSCLYTYEYKVLHHKISSV